MRSTSIRVVFALAMISAACGDDDADSPAPVGTGGNGSAGAAGKNPRGDADASRPQIHEDGGPPAMLDAEIPGGETVQDRCIADGCGPSQLPAQPELEFLEDMGDGWKRLTELDWNLAAGAEGYRCKTLTIPQDVYIVAFAPQSPPGTHHATFGVSETSGGPDQVVACGVGNQGERRLQGSGAGSEPFELPEGVAMPLHAGDQVFMNLHLFNVSEKPLSGRSGMWVKTAEKSEVKNEAETVLAGPLALDIPIGRSTQRGSCTLRADATIYAVGPHMHQTGVHLRATAMTAGGEVMIYDGDYDFNHQLLHDVDDVQLKAGDKINIECTYQNETDRTLHWGDSSLAEMCFIGLSLYPAIGYGQLPCSN